MLLCCLLLLLLFAQAQSKLLFKNEANANPILNLQLGIPQIPSPYNFVTKTINLDAIGNNLNPNLVDRTDIHKELLNNGVKQQNQRKEDAEKLSLQQNNKLKQLTAQPKQGVSSHSETNKTLNQKQSKTNQSSKSNAFDHPLQPIILRSINVTEEKLQKIDVKKLMKQIEKEQKQNSQTRKQKLPKIYQQIFGAIDQRLIGNQTKAKSMANSMGSLQKSKSQQLEFKSQNKQQIKPSISVVSQPRSQQQKTEGSEQQILGKVQNEQQINEQRQKNQAQTQKLLSKQSELQKEKEQLQKELIQFKFKYFQLLKQTEEDREAQSNRRQQLQTDNSNAYKKKSNATTQTSAKINTEYSFNFTTAITVATVLTLLLLYFWRSQASNNRENSLSTDDRQKLSSDDQID